MACSAKSPALFLQPNRKSPACKCSLYGSDCSLRSTGERPATGNASVRCKRRGGSIDSAEFLASSYETCTLFLFRPCHLSFSRVASPSACQASSFINNRQPEADSAPGNTPSFLLQEFHACEIPILAPREPSRCVSNPIDEIYQLPSLVFYTVIVFPRRFLRFLSAAASVSLVLFLFLPSVYLANYLSVVD